MMPHIATHKTDVLTAGVAVVTAAAVVCGYKTVVTAVAATEEQ